MSNSANNKRIAKNTIFLYFRTLLVMAVSLYTSRVVLGALGVEDFGVYNVIGGAIAMFGIVSGALSNTISRFITYELGKNNYSKLSQVFSTSVNVQIVISLVAVLIGETLGLWFLNNRLNIPANRIDASFWVLQCSLASFCIGLISIPYNACIIAHEHMQAFAYVSVFEAVGKLGVCFFIAKSPWDRLVFYSVLLVFVAVLVRLVYGIYCHKHFVESHYKFSINVPLLKEIGAFAGWGFFTNGAYVFNTQGVNLLINMFYGVAFNAARGVALQVENAIMQFVNNFSMAINPQITKNYAVGDFLEMYSLVCRGARFSYFLLLLFALPFLLETEYVLYLWLNTVPEKTALFFRLGLVGTMLTMLGNTGYTACMATGKIRGYVLWITSIGCLVFPITLILYTLGAPVYAAYLTYIFVYLVVDFVRLILMKNMLDFPIKMFFKDVLCRISLVTLLSAIAPLLIRWRMDESMERFCLVVFVGILSTVGSISVFGLSASERKNVLGVIRRKFRRG